MLKKNEMDVQKNKRKKERKQEIIHEREKDVRKEKID